MSSLLNLLMVVAIGAACFCLMMYVAPILIKQQATRIPSREERKAWPKGSLPRFWPVMLLRVSALALVLGGFYVAPGSEQYKAIAASLVSLPILIDGVVDIIRRCKA